MLLSTLAGGGSGCGIWLEVMMKILLVATIAEFASRRKAGISQTSIGPTA